MGSGGENLKQAPCTAGSPMRGLISQTRSPEPKSGVWMLNRLCTHVPQILVPIILYFCRTVGYFRLESQQPFCLSSQASSLVEDKR